MPLPPVESGPAAMTRRNFLVETNRLRVSQYAPTRKQLEEEDVRIAKARQTEKFEKQAEWTQFRKKAADSQGAAAAAPGRALPGASLRSMRASGKAAPSENTYKLMKEEELAKKLEYNRLYDLEAKRQLADREETVRRMHDEETAQMEALNEVNAEQDRKVAEAHAKAAEEDRHYLERLKQSNKRELAAKKAEQLTREARDRELHALVSENNRHRDEMDVRRQKNVTRMLQLQNEDFHKDATRSRKATEAKNYEEAAAMAELNRRLAKEEQEAAQQKKEQFRQDFEECIARDKEFRRTHMYDESVEVTRQRNELAAHSYRVIRQEERLRDAERRQQYRQDLMGQIAAKHTFRMTHLDEPGL